MKASIVAYSVVSASDVLALVGSDSAVLLLDVRTPAEFHAHRIPGAVLLPVHELLARVEELDLSRKMVCICEHGIRSESAAAFLASRGVTDVATMAGGMARWPGEVESG